MQFSVVIPTLNEEKNITRVIRQFCPFNKYSCEVIVCDGGSRDKTLEIAKSFGAVVVKNSPGSTIGYNRNKGAEKAKGDILIFCDADTKLENTSLFFKRVSEVFQDKSIIAGMPRIAVFPQERLFRDCIFHGVYNGVIRLSIMLGINLSSGQCQVVRRESFFKVGGYPKDQVHGEDTTLFRKLGRIGRLHYFSELCVYESPRRYRELGYFRLIATGLLSFIGQAILMRNILKEWKRVD